MSNNCCVCGKTISGFNSEPKSIPDVENIISSEGTGSAYNIIGLLVKTSDIAQGQPGKPDMKFICIDCHSKIISKEIGIECEFVGFLGHWIDRPARAD
jgi:hypothetical protein